MEILFLLICVSVSVATIFLILFIWSVKNGQYEDCYTPSLRIFFDDNKEDKKSKHVNQTSQNKGEKVL